MARITKQGTIVKKIDQRTVSVETFRMKSHPIYKKKFKVVKKFLADDRGGKFKEGDIVVIEECRPLSKTKRFKVLRKVGSMVVGEDKIAGEEILGSEDKTQEENTEEETK